MLCSRCAMHPATTGEGLCDGCVVAEANAAPPPPSLAMPISGPRAVLQSPVGLGRAVVTLLCLVLACDVVVVAVSFNLKRVVDNLEGGDVSRSFLADVARIERWLTHVGGLLTLMNLATAALFIVWFYRVRGNAQVFAPDLLTRGRGWAVGGWFIPIGNLWIPRGIAAEVWQASRKDPYSGDERLASPVNLWWTSLLVTWFLDRFANYRADKAESLAELSAATDLLIVWALVDIAAAVLAIVFVHRLTQMQHAKALRGPEPVAV